MPREKNIFEKGAAGRRGVRVGLPPGPPGGAEDLLPGVSLRKNPPALPELAEPEIMRHYVKLSTMNHHVDRDLYPLGSCTMKYNPKVHEVVARLPGWARLHPCQTPESVPGAVRLTAELSHYLAEITGMASVSLQPAAGAQGELAGLLMTRAYFRDRGEDRRLVLIPDSAHGTNPASVRMAGFETRQIGSDARGEIDPDSLRCALSDDVAALMVTNPNTLGIFETRIGELAGMVHSAGALLYMDGANMNALLGIARPGDMGVDLLHLNLHKTFSGPHGGGGPGAGPIAASEALAPYLPSPLAVLEGDRAHLDYDRPRSIGRLHGFFGNFGVMVRAYCYIRSLGAAGLREVSETAILHANYLMEGLRSSFELPYDRRCQHEFVLSACRQKKRGVRAQDIAKRLLDFGFHSPTVYFPLIVDEALMIEPTETETKETLDRFIAAMNAIAREAEEEPELLREAPHRTPVRRVDEARAAREMDVIWT